MGSRIRVNHSSTRKTVALVMALLFCAWSATGQDAAALGHKETTVDFKALMSRLENGNQRFVQGKPLRKDFTHERKELVAGQQPYAIVLSCADSRVSPELIFDESLGQLFVVRNAGNLIDSIMLGSIEYAAEHLHTHLLLVLGHESCGAVSAAVSGGAASPNITSIVMRIAPAVEAMKAEHVPEANMVHATVAENVRNQMRKALSHSEVLRELAKQGKFEIIGGVYSLETGEVTFVKSSDGNQPGGTLH